MKLSVPWPVAGVVSVLVAPNVFFALVLPLLVLVGMGSVPFHGCWCEMERNGPSVMESRVILRNPTFLVPCEMA